MQRLIKYFKKIKHDYFAIIPDEVILNEILKKIDTKTLTSVSRVNKRFYRLTSSLTDLRFFQGIRLETKLQLLLDKFNKLNILFQLEKSKLETLIYASRYNSNYNRTLRLKEPASAAKLMENFSVIQAIIYVIAQKEPLLLSQILDDVKERYVEYLKHMNATMPIAKPDKNSIPYFYDYLVNFIDRLPRHGIQYNSTNVIKHSNLK